MREVLRGALVIARRDFAATVFSKSFLLFLLAPLFPVVVGLVFGGLTISAATRQAESRVVAVVAGQQEFAALAAAHQRIDTAFKTSALVRLRHASPEADRLAQRQRLLSGREGPVIGILEGGLSSPRFSTTVPPPALVLPQLQLVIDQARAAQQFGTEPVRLSMSQFSGPSLGRPEPERYVTAQAAQGILFILTILLATMLLSQLIEEKASKILEVLAAAVPVSSIFLGKLLAMLSVSLLGIALWGSAVAVAIGQFAEQGLSAIPPPAVGWPMFLALGLVYFAMSYLLLGAIFLGIGAHASTAREVQTLSLPVTMAQVVVFAIAALAIGEPDSLGGLAAAAFPLSSPYVMLARGAQLPQLWPHLLAIVWQLLWVAIILHIASRLFRRSVLKSGRPARARRTAVA